MWYDSQEVPGTVAYERLSYDIEFSVQRVYSWIGANIIAESGYPEILNFAGNPYMYRELGETVETASMELINLLILPQGGSKVEIGQRKYPCP